MGFDISNRLVIGVASSCMFDLSESDAVFRQQGEEAYRHYQEARLSEPLNRGIAFSFIRRLLGLNDLFGEDSFIEVLLLSRNDPDTGLRVMRSIQHYDLNITRSVFCQGQSPYQYIGALNICLFLSGSDVDVREAVQLGFPAGQVIDSKIEDDPKDLGLRIAFDFDGVLADDQSENIMQSTKCLNEFHRHETSRSSEPLPPGPLQNFLLQVKKIQLKEMEKKRKDPAYQQRLRVALVTARNAPSHERAVNTLKSWGVMPNDAFFLGGIDKHRVLGVLRPHIFFDDQVKHLQSTSQVSPSVHIPFGSLNNTSEPTG